MNYLTETARTGDSKNSDLVAFSCFNFELPSIKETELTNKNLLTKLNVVNV